MFIYYGGACSQLYTFYFSSLVNLFTVVRFPNSVCAGDAFNGTCYTSEECNDRGGTSSGTCANGYGVCCICKCNKIHKITDNSFNPEKVDVWNPCHVWRVVAATTTLKKCYKLRLFDQIVSQIRAYIK